MIYSRDFYFTDRTISKTRYMKCLKCNKKVLNKQQITISVADNKVEIICHL